MQSRFSIIIDFDSTIISVETLEFLADISLSNQDNKTQLLQEISHYTNLAMNGEISFEKSLDLRFDLMKINETHIKESIKILKKKIDSSFLKNLDFIKKNMSSIYVVSGGFKSIIHPILNHIFETDWNIYANDFMFNSLGEVLGVKKNNPLSKSKGKVQLIKSLNLNNDIIMVGDGYTDYEVKKFNEAKYFLAYAAHVKRNNVIENSDFVCNNFSDVIEFINKKYN